MKLLHISYDYPDEIDSQKPPAIKKLIDTIGSNFNNYSISLNRTDKIEAQRRVDGTNLTSMAVFGLPYGLDFRSFLIRAGRAVLRLDLDYKRFDFIFAYKLTFEGPVAAAIHRKFSVPFIIVIRQTDIKVLKYRPDLRGKYRSILNQAAAIVFPSHWLKQSLEAIIGGNFYDQIIRPKSFLIPNICGMEYNIPAREDNGRYICVVSMKKDYYRIKNFDRLISAFKLAANDNKDIHLDIFGYGEGMDRIRTEVNRTNMTANITVNGPVDNKDIPALLSGYRAFIMPSYPETFGLVYVEALRSGIPIIFAKHTAVEGFFNGYDCQIQVDHTSVISIYEAISKIEAQHDRYRAETARLQSDGILDMFTSSSVSDAFRHMLESLSTSGL